jgi:hypothetical protein
MKIERDIPEAPGGSRGMTLPIARDAVEEIPDW